MASDNFGDDRPRDGVEPAVVSSESVAMDILCSLTMNIKQDGKFGPNCRVK